MFNKKKKKKHTKKDQQTNQSKLEKQNEKIIVFLLKEINIFSRNVLNKRVLV